MVEGRLTRGAPFLLSRTRAGESPRPSPRGSLLTGPQRHAPPITADSNEYQIGCLLHATALVTLHAHR